MSEQQKITDVTTADGVVIERVFDAPRELVFRAWTEPEHFAKWYGPNGFTTPHCVLDVRVGGRLQFCMRHPQMGDIWNGGRYQIIDPPSRLVYTNYLADEDGNKVPPSQYGIEEGFPEETTVDLRFEDLGGGTTKMTMRHSIPSEMAGHAGEGWRQSFDRLGEHLKTI
jgi:uncharacterized protein YndB with AHSA1/START domain